MFDQIRIVLINTSHPGNIGAVARAMKNMGFARLYLVQPQQYPDSAAVGRASGATDILDAAQVVETLEEALAGCSLVVGASARERRIPWPVVTPRDLADDVGDALVPVGDVAILFGREDRGLTNEELQRCNLHVHIPANPEYSSLNLAMAVQVITYELRMKFLSARAGENKAPELVSMTSPQDSGWDVAPATTEEVERYLVHLEETLVQIGFHNPENPRQLMARLRRLYQRCRLDRMEVNILRGILTAQQQALEAEARRNKADR